MRKLLTFLLEIGLVGGGLAVLAWQFLGQEMAQSGLYVIGGASAVSIGLMLLYEGFVTPGPRKVASELPESRDGVAQNDGDYSDPGPFGDQARNGALSGKHEQL
jgi:hypothetical protein